MSDITLRREARVPCPELTGSALTDHARRLFQMYAGDETTVKLRFHRDLINVVIDRFGKEVPVLPVDGAHFQAFVDVAVSPQFLGWVAGLGGGLRIVSPEPVVQKMQALVQRLAEQYCAPDGDKTSV